MVDADNNVYELTSGSPVGVVSRSTDDEGYLNGYWNLTGTWENYVVSAIQVNVYHRWDAGSWSLRRIYISDDDLIIRLPNAQWTFTYHVERAYSGGITSSYFRFGEGSYNSGLSFYSRRVSPFTTMLYELKSGNFLSFIATPFTYHGGDMFYGFIVLFLAITTYNRYQDVRPVIVMMWVFGGAGSVLNALIPPFALNIAYILLAVALATTLWKLLR
jgi:hypothetical protein